MNKNCFPQPIEIGPCEAVPVVFLSTEIDGVDDVINPPENGAYRNTIVRYTLTDHVYIYDSAGIPTRTNSTGIIDDKLNIESSNPVENRVITKAIADTAEALQININLEVMARQSDRDNLQTNINKLAEKEEADVTGLQEDVAEANQRIDDIINSPDVRYIVSTYADLEKIDKSKVGDQDYARVLQDETHEEASTYYQYSKADKDWNYVGQTGPYYTKEQSDDKYATKQSLSEGLSSKQDTLVSATNIKTINGESILGEGNIEIDSGGAIDILTAYNASPAADAVYSARYINSRLDGGTIRIGNNAYAHQSFQVIIGNRATAGRNSHSGDIAIGDDTKIDGGLAIGYSAKSLYTNSVALGAATSNSREAEFSIGGSTSPYYPLTRFLANVTAGELDTDAVNKKQMEDYVTAQVGNINTALTTLISGTGA